MSPRPPALRQYAGLLAAYLRPQRARVALLALALIGSIALQLATPQLLRAFIDTARSAAPPDALTAIALAFIGIVLVSQILTPAVTYLSETVSWAALNRLRVDLALHCLRLDMAFHTTRTPGELIERVDGDVNALANFFSQFVIRILGNFLLMVGALAVLLGEDWRVGLALAAFVTVSLAVLRGVGGVAVPYFRAHRQAFAEVSGFWEERVGGAEDIRGVGAVPYTLARQLSLLRRHATAATKSLVMGRVTQSVWELLLAGGNALAFALGAALLYGGGLTIGAIYLIFAYTELVSRNLFAISQQIDDLQRARAGIERIRELLDRQSRLSDGALALPPGPLDVAFEHVSFVYEPDGPPAADDGALPSVIDNGSPAIAQRPSPHALDGISFELAAGQTLGVLGRTGSGKTTLARLLARFADPRAGAIRLGGIDLRDLQIGDLRRRVGFVTQDVQLFHGTVRDNLTFWDDGVPDAAIDAALRDLGLEAWRARLPDGLDTRLAPGGGLSAGEAQLLALARVFLQDPGLVILDEASARLDPTAERLIEGAIDRLLRGRTAIVIAHRLDTLLRADAILVLEGGRAVEHGARAALQGDPSSRFARLLRAGRGEILP